jgi:hypothetical protein
MLLFGIIVLLVVLLIYFLCHLFMELPEIYGGALPNRGRAPRYAWVTLVMLGDRYVPGAMLIGHSMKMQRTVADTVCMVTEDVSVGARDELARVFDVVVLVPILKFECAPLKTQRQNEIYGAWMSVAITKWNCLTLTDYDKVCFVDADAVAVANCDELFKLRTPAGVFSNLYANNYDRNSSMHNFYGHTHYGMKISHHTINKALNNNGFVAWGHCVVLAPSMGVYQTLMDECARLQPIKFNCYSSIDEQVLAYLYAVHMKQDWTNISQSYNMVSWKPSYLKGHVPKIYHALGTEKPTEIARDKWPDIIHFYKIAADLAAAQPTLSFITQCRLLGPPEGDKSGGYTEDKSVGFIVYMKKDEGSTGLMQDAAVYAEAYADIGYTAVYIKPWIEHDADRTTVRTQLAQCSIVIGIEEFGDAALIELLSSWRDAGGKLYLLANLEILDRHKPTVAHLKSTHLDGIIVKARGLIPAAQAAAPGVRVLCIRHTLPMSVLKHIKPHCDHSDVRDTIVHYAGSSWLKNSLENVRAGIELAARLNCKFVVKLTPIKRGKFLSADVDAIRALAASHKFTLIDHYQTEAEKHALYARSRLALCCSRAEGYGYYIMEAAAHGLQVITTNGIPMNEILQKQVVLAGTGVASPLSYGYSYKVSHKEILEAAAALEPWNATACAQAHENVQLSRAAFEVDFKHEFIT